MVEQKKIIITDVASGTNKRGDKKCKIITDARDDKFWIWNPNLFKLCVADTAVMLSGETQGDYFNVDNIEVLDEGVEPEPTATTSRGLANNGEETRQVAPQERGMWFKEVGENFRAGIFKWDDKEKPRNKLRLMAYFTAMDVALGVTEEKSTNKGE